jgi:hypothetical protein
LTPFTYLVMYYLLKMGSRREKNLKQNIFKHKMVLGLFHPLLQA